MKTNLGTLLITLAALASTGCTVKETVEHTTAAGNGTTLALGSSNAISVVPASSLQCDNGGSVYRVFIDSNGNGLLDGGETVVNSQVVCNGSNGVSGMSTLFSMSRVTTGLEACASQSGLQINSGLDANHNGVLDASEIIGSQILCDGATGATGSGGAAGSDGYNMVFQSTAATTEQCSAGGSTIVMALDSNRNNHFDAADSNIQSITLCNGVAGAAGAAGSNGTNGTNAVLPAYTAVEPIMPCGNTVAYKEVLLRLSNGQVLSSFSDNAAGSMTRLAFLPDGSFVDTDDSDCHFSLSTSADKSTRAISWSGQVQESWAINH